MVSKNSDNYLYSEESNNCSSGKFKLITTFLFWAGIIGLYFWGNKKRWQPNPYPSFVANEEVVRSIESIDEPTYYSMLNVTGDSTLFNENGVPILTHFSDGWRQINPAYPFAGSFRGGGSKELGITQQLGKPPSSDPRAKISTSTNLAQLEQRQPANPKSPALLLSQEPSSAAGPSSFLKSKALVAPQEQGLSSAGPSSSELGSTSRPLISPAKSHLMSHDEEIQAADRLELHEAESNSRDGSVSIEARGSAYQENSPSSSDEEAGKIKQTYFSSLCSCFDSKTISDPASSNISFSVDPANQMNLNRGIESVAPQKADPLSASPRISSPNSLPVVESKSIQKITAGLNPVSKSQVDQFKNSVSAVLSRKKKTGIGCGYVQCHVNKETNIVSIQGVFKNETFAEAVKQCASQVFGPNFKKSNFEIEHLKSQYASLLPRHEQPCALLEKSMHREVTKNLNITSAINFKSIEQTPNTVNDKLCEQYGAEIDSATCKLAKKEITFSTERTKKIVGIGFDLCTRGEEQDLRRLGFSNTAAISRGIHLQLKAYADKSLELLDGCCFWNGEKKELQPLVNLEQWARHKNSVRVCLKGLTHLANCQNYEAESTISSILFMQQEIQARFTSIANKLDNYPVVAPAVLSLDNTWRNVKANPPLFWEAVKDSNFLQNRGQINLDCLIEMQGAGVEANLFTPAPAGKILVTKERQKLKTEEKNAIYLRLVEHYGVSELYSELYTL